MKRINNNRIWKITLALITLIPWLVYLPLKVYLVLKEKTSFIGEMSLGGDFINYYYKAWKSFINDKNLYKVEGYYYLPFTAIFSPISLLDLNQAVVTFIVINVVFIVLSFIELKKILGNFYSLLVIFSYPSYRCFFLLQIDYILFYLFLKSLILYEKNKRISILLLAMASSIKVFIVFLIPTIFKRKFKDYFIFILFLLLLNLPFLIINFRQQLSGLLRNISTFKKEAPSLISILRLPSEYTILFVICYYLAYKLYSKRVNIGNFIMETFLNLFLLLLLTHLWIHYLFIVYPLLFYLIKKTKFKEKRLLFSILIFISYISITPLTYYVNANILRFSSHILNIIQLTIALFTFCNIVVRSSNKKHRASIE